MPKNMQNLVVLMERYYDDDYEISLKGGNMSLNRFCVDEDAAFELSGVHYSKKPKKYNPNKGKGYLSLKLMVSVCFDSFYWCRTF